jgi:hypothetical protein
MTNRAVLTLAVLTIISYYIAILDLIEIIFKYKIKLLKITLVLIYIRAVGRTLPTCATQAVKD